MPPGGPSFVSLRLFFWLHLFFFFTLLLLHRCSSYHSFFFILFVIESRLLTVAPLFTIFLQELLCALPFLYYYLLHSRYTPHYRHIQRSLSIISRRYQCQFVPHHERRRQ